MYKKKYIGGLSVFVQNKKKEDMYQKMVTIPRPLRDSIEGAVLAETTDCSSMCKSVTASESKWFSLNLGVIQSTILRKDHTLFLQTTEHPTLNVEENTLSNESWRSKLRNF